MDFGTAISTCLSKYADFNGRARRSEFWFFYLFNVIVSVVVGILSAAISVPALQFLPFLALIVPTLAAVVRRLHDTGRSGGWIFIGLIPLVGIILLIVWTATDGTPGPNQFGANPKGDYAPGYA